MVSIDRYHVIFHVQINHYILDKLNLVQNALGYRCFFLFVFFVVQSIYFYQMLILVDKEVNLDQLYLQQVMDLDENLDVHY